MTTHARPACLIYALLFAACNDSGGPGTPRPGHLYVADGVSVYIYSTPLRSGDGPIDSLSFPRGIDPVFVAVDGSGNLAVSIDGGPIYWYSAPVTHTSIPTDSVGSGGVGYPPLDQIIDYMYSAPGRL